MSTTLTEVDEYRPGRNFIKVGDTVKCKPLSGTKFKAIVNRILANEEGKIVEIEVYRPRSTGYCGFRTFVPERVSWVTQPRTD